MAEVMAMDEDTVMGEEAMVGKTMAMDTRAMEDTKARPEAILANNDKELEPTLYLFSVCMQHVIISI